MRFAGREWWSRGTQVRFDLFGDEGFIDLGGEVVGMTVQGGILFVLTENGELRAITGDNPENYRVDVVHRGVAIQFVPTRPEDQPITEDERAELLAQDDSARQIWPPVEQPNGDTPQPNGGVTSLPTRPDSNPADWSTEGLAGVIDASTTYEPFQGIDPNSPRQWDPAPRPDQTNIFASNPLWRHLREPRFGEAEAQREIMNEVRRSWNGELAAAIEREAQRERIREARRQYRENYGDWLHFLNPDHIDLFANPRHNAVITGIRPDDPAAPGASPEAPAAPPPARPEGADGPASGTTEEPGVHDSPRDGTLPPY